MIAIVYPQFYGVGGIARYLDSFLSNLPENHPQIYLITGDEHRQRVSYAGVEIIHVPFTSNRFNLILWTLKVRKLLVQLYKQKKIQWVNLHIPPLIPGLLLPRHIPMLLTAHTTYLGMSGNFYKVRHFNSQWSAVSLKVKSWMEHYIFSQTKKMIVLTEQAKQEAIAYGYKGPITVIPNGVDLNNFTPSTNVTKDIDVLFCGRIEQRKGSRAMVDLCRLLILKKPDIVICIVGYGDDDVWVKDKLSLYKNVTLTGQVPFKDAMSFYQRSRVYASTSYYEGLPGTCLEAMAMQLPVVVWNFLFYRELVKHDETGMVVAVNDFQAMTSQILILLKNVSKSESLGKNARNHLEHNYGWHKLASDVLAAFNN